MNLMKWLVVSSMVVVAAGCKHPLQIEGEGNIVSRTGDRNCTAEQAPCDNVVLNAYQETYTALAKPGSAFLEWQGCGLQYPKCSFNIPANVVKDFVDETTAPLKAIFVDRPIVTIPVIFHVFYYSEETDIGKNKILSQLRVLNQDFNGRTANNTQLPEEFQHLIGNARIQFKLAWVTRTEYDPTAMTDEEMYFTDRGGRDVWKSDTYLNVYVIESLDRHGRVVKAGYAQQPGGDPRTDAVMVAVRAFGTQGILYGGLTGGRTLSHEVGHWLSLSHIRDKCDVDDDVDDTPLHGRRYLGNPANPQFSCGTQDMVNNIMLPGVHDKHSLFFTKGQVGRMQSTFLPGEGRHTLFVNNGGEW